MLLREFPIRRKTMKRGPGDGLEILGKFNPGLGDQTFDFGGSAKFVPKGSDVVFEIHYTAVGGRLRSANPPWDSCWRRIVLSFAISPLMDRLATIWDRTQ